MDSANQGSKYTFKSLQSILLTKCLLSGSIDENE